MKRIMRIDSLGISVNNPIMANRPSKVEDPSFAKILEQAEKSEDKAKLWEACQEFESVFVYQMLKKMRETIPKNELFNGGMGEEVFQGLLDEETAKNLSSNGGMGLAKMIFEQMTQSTAMRPPINDAGATENK